MLDRGFHSLPLCTSHIIRATPKTKSLVKSLHDKYRNIPSHGSVTWLSEICNLICRDEVLDLMFILPNYWNPVSKRTVFPCMSSCLLLPPMEGVRGHCSPLRTGWHQNPLSRCVPNSPNIFPLNSKLCSLFLEIVKIGGVIITRII